MAAYHVYVSCSECSGAHRVDDLVDLKDGPSKVMSVEKAYLNRPIPTRLLSVIAKFTYCERKKCAAIQNDLSRIFLADA